MLGSPIRILRSRGKQIQTEALGKKLRDQLTLHTIAGSVKSRSKNAESALAWRHRHHSAADTALAAGTPISYNQSPEFS
jgi:hypothetical protein